MGEAVMGEGNEYVVMLCTAPPAESEGLASMLLEEKLAACVNVTALQSHFFWEGRVCHEREDLLIIKTRAALSPLVTRRIKELHSYQVPEIIVLPIVGGFQPYLSWIGSSVREP
ncbi:MAG: divalent-cation tolerance protein CutA [Methanosarcinales archaeon]|nr:divalent-cation tolerance protein CutA [Methanosarcinales archaeon]